MSELNKEAPCLFAWDDNTCSKKDSGGKSTDIPCEKCDQYIPQTEFNTIELSGNKVRLRTSQETKADKLRDEEKQRRMRKEILGETMSRKKKVDECCQNCVSFDAVERECTYEIPKSELPHHIGIEVFREKINYPWEVHYCPQFYPTSKEVKP